MKLYNSRNSQRIACYLVASAQLLIWMMFTTGPGDEGIDGIAVVIDEVVTPSVEDAQAIFASPRRNHDVDVLFVQAKRSESFDLGEFLKFKEGILRFATQTPYGPTDEVLSSAREMFDVVLNEVPKVRNGKPSLTARFVTNGHYQKPVALETALTDFKAQLDALGLFHDIDVRFVDRDELTRLWVGTYTCGSPASSVGPRGSMRARRLGYRRRNPPLASVGFASLTDPRIIFSNRLISRSRF